MSKFNFTRGKRTRKGKLNSIRIITKEHDAYKIYLKGQGLRKVKGLPYNGVLTKKEVLEAAKALKEEKK